MENTIQTSSNETPRGLQDAWDKPSPLLKSKIVFSAILGNALEFYDFALFGAFSVLFSTLFFPEGSVSSLLSTLAIFALAFFVRPLGSVIFGYLGDVLGRKKALGSSILLMGVFTFFIGCLPTFDTVGYAAPILLLCCRLGQGFCLGGENNGSAVFLLEHHKHRKGYAGALILTGGAIGTITAISCAIISQLDFMPEWAWRVPFLLGIGIGGLGIYIRRSLDETPAFINRKKDTKDTVPLLYVFKHYTSPLLCAVGIGGVNGVMAYTLVVYTNVYLATVVHYPLIDSLLYSCIGLTMFGFMAPIAGHIADIFGAKRVMALSCLLALVIAPMNLYLLQQQTISTIFFAIGGSALLMSLFNGPTNAFLQDLFPTKVRYTGIAFGYAVGAALFGGTQPLICTYLIELTSNPYSPAFYVAFISGIGGLALHFANKPQNDSGFSQITPEYSRPSDLMSPGRVLREKEVA